MFVINLFFRHPFRPHWLSASPPNTLHRGVGISGKGLGTGAGPRGLLCGALQLARSAARERTCGVGGPCTGHLRIASRELLWMCCVLSLGPVGQGAVRHVALLSSNTRNRIGGGVL